MPFEGGCVGSSLSQNRGFHAIAHVALTISPGGLEWSRFVRYCYLLSWSALETERKRVLPALSPLGLIGTL